MARYKSVHTGPQIDSGVARALPGGEIDLSLANVSRALPGGEIDQLRPNWNLLDNWDFRNPVNQRGASGTISEAGYFIDRWKLISGTVTITANGLTLNGTIRQIRENAVGVATTHSVDMYSGTATATYDDTTKYCDIVSSGGTIARCKLEIGSASTLANDPPADYGEELRKCQRYFYRLKSQNRNNYGVLALGRIQSNTQGRFLVNFPDTMRTTPTYSMSGALEIYSNTTGYAVTSLGYQTFNGNALLLIANCAANEKFVVGNIAHLNAANDVNAYIDFSADL